MLPRFEIVHRVRPVDLVRPGTLPLAPYVGVEADLTGTGTGAVSGTGAEVRLRSGGTDLAGTLDERGLALRVTHDGRTTHHRSRRHGRPGGPVEALALTLTGPHLVVWSRGPAQEQAQEPAPWQVRGRVDLTDRLDVHDEGWLAGLEADSAGAVGEVRHGGFGQLGLRDVRLVTHADGTPYREDGGSVLLTATSAGPGAFPTAHASVWALETSGLGLTHRADLFFRRPDRPGVFGDHACHLLRDGDRWRVATSTWGDFDRRRPDATVGVTLAGSTDDLTRGVHVLDTRPLDLPTTGFTSVGVWDPHLVRTGDGWLVGYVSARRFFRFHPVLAQGTDLDRLTLRAAATGRRATEGTTLARLDGDWRVLASDGRDGRRGQRERFPVLDLDLTETGTLEAPYPTNIPWPTLLETDEGWLMVTFNGTAYGGPLVGYGSHGALVLARARPA